MPNNPLVDSFEIIESDKDSHFRDQLTQGQSEEENIDFPTNWGLIQCNKCEIRNVLIESDQPLNYELFFFANDVHSDTDLDLDKAITSMVFSDPVRIGNPPANQYYYTLDPATFPFIYIDEDNTSEFHITLINRDATTKTAGDAGSSVIKIHAVPIV